MESILQHDLNDFPREQLFELLIDQLDGLLVCDAEGRYVFVSRRWTELTGLSLGEVKGLYVHDIMPDTRVHHVLKTGQSLSGELVKLRNNRGEEFHIICSYTPLFQDDKVIGCFTVSSIHGMGEVMGISSKTDCLLRQLNYYQKELAEIQGAKYSLDNIVGNSARMQVLKTAIHRVARSPSTVVIHGETGSGKELVAHSIHVLSPRAARPFIKVNCAAIPSELLEAELFGYEPGAFTGASRSGKKGKFQLADTGTLFLDEINQLPLHLQPKLLRALQEQEIEPVGGVKTVPVDCRIISASNISLEKMVKAGTFREDLFYRLNVVSLDVPPLRERREDIPVIADTLLKRLNAQLGMEVPGIAEDVIVRLKEYDWPGNVRELQNVIERAMNLSWVDTLTWSHFEDYFRQRLPVGHNVVVRDVFPIRAAKNNAEKEMLIQALHTAAGNKTSAAAMLGVTRAMLYRKLKKYGL